MNTTTKNAYTYQMKLVPANILCIVIFLLCFILSIFINKNLNFYEGNTVLLFLFIILYMMLHEFLHGVGYFIGGTKRKNIQYGICLEKGIFYAMAYQELTKKNILISLQMPFMVIGVITYVIGMIFNIPLLVLLSIINISGAAMDLAMFFYILKLPKDIIYSESGNPDEFVIISKDDLKKHKSMFLKIVDEKKYNKSDYVFNIDKKLVISRNSIIILVLFIILGILLSII